MMGRKTKIAAGIGGGLLVLGVIGAAVGGDDVPESATAPATVTVTATPPPEAVKAAETINEAVETVVETVTETVTEEARTVTETMTVTAAAEESLDTGADIGGMTDAEIDRMALEVTWDGLSASDKDDICLGIDIFGAGEVADEYFGHADRDVVIEFFEEVCG